MMKWKRMPAWIMALALIWVVTAAFPSQVRADAVPPTVTTTEPSPVCETTAFSGGNVTDDGGDAVTERGVCWSISPDPTISDSKTSDGTGTGTFTSRITGLDPATQYHVRAYATNSTGTSYGEDKNFTTTPLSPFPGFTIIACPWFLAEGSNAWGFSTYITLMNPSKKETEAEITYMDPNPPESGSGVIKSRTIILPPLSQTTVSSVSDIGEVDFSTVVGTKNGHTIGVDRTMYWTGTNSEVRGYHSSIGVNWPSPTWYFPEGSSDWGFETWIAVLNPNEEQANVTLTYMTEDGIENVANKTIPPNSRATWSMAEDIGAADASIKVDSDVEVVAERSMYRDSRREGSCSVGCDEYGLYGVSNCYLAEGAVGYGPGFTTYILIQNPNYGTNDVKLTFQTGSGEIQGPVFTMEPNSRKTVCLNDMLPPDTDVSTEVNGSNALIAERSMYWNSPTGQAFHASISNTWPYTSSHLPDGQNDENAQTWTLVANPNSEAATVKITYLPQDGEEVLEFTDEIPANSRRSYNMADHVNGRASILVERLEGGWPIIVERSMYGTNWSWGTNTVGREPEIIQ